MRRGRGGGGGGGGGVQEAHVDGAKMLDVRGTPVM